MRNKVLGAGIVGALVLLLLNAWGAIHVNWPWSGVRFTERAAAVGVVDVAKIEAIEPISLDCRVRVHAVVPIEGRKEHRVLGQVYRTDTMRMEAVGDIDTCVDASLVEIVERPDGGTRVIIPAEAIRFVRPRVDAVATRASVDYDQGLIGKLTDVFPWVDDSEGLTAGGYAYAQGVIGGSSCMQAAYDLTRQLLEDAYLAQAEERGHAPGAVSVAIQGTPDFGQNGTPDLGDLEFETRADEVSCEVAPDAAPGYEPTPEPPGR